VPVVSFSKYLLPTEFDVLDPAGYCGRPACAGIEGDTVGFCFPTQSIFLSKNAQAFLAAFITLFDFDIV